MEESKEMKKEMLELMKNSTLRLNIGPPSLNMGDATKISEKDNWLQRPFDEEEVLDVVKKCASDKARGSDGYTMWFFQKCWSTLEEDIIRANEHIHQHESQKRAPVLQTFH